MDYQFNKASGQSINIFQTDLDLKSISKVVSNRKKWNKRYRAENEHFH